MILREGDILKFFRLVSCICLLVGCMFSFVFADTVSDSAIEDPDPSIFEVDDSSSGLTVVVNNPNNDFLLEAIERISSSSSTEDYVPSIAYTDMQLRSVNVSNERISASDANGFKAVVLGLLGDYDTIITDYTYQNQQGYTQHSIDVTPDWSWIGSGVIFLVVVYCSFRIIGGLLCSR